MSGDLQNAISLIKSGHKAEAKLILIQILEEDNQNEKAWIWMSAVVDTDEMRLECLDEVLKINPDNHVAQKGAAKLRENLPAPEPVVESEPESEIEDKHDSDFLVDDGWYDPIEPDLPFTTAQETFSYEKYAAEPNPDIKSKSSKAAPRQRNPLTYSPWITIWYRPRVTMRAIIESDPKKDVLLIVILSGILGFFTGTLVSFMITGDFTVLIIFMILTLILGPLIGIAQLYIMGAVLGFTGMLLGGKGTAEEVRAALAWGNIPTFAISAVMIPFILMLFATMPSSEQVMQPGASVSPLVSLSSCFLMLTVPFFLYSFYFVFLQSLAEAHQFSGWRAFFSILLPGIIFNCAIWFTAFLSGIGMAL